MHGEYSTSRATIEPFGGITPTCMGNTHRFDQWYPVHWDHPHMHGEYCLKNLVKDKKLGSPPHAWGIRNDKNYDAET